MRVLALTFFLFAFAMAHGQVQQPGRFEISLREGDEESPYRVASLRERGLVAYRRLVGKREDQIELIKIDTSLKEEWRGYIQVEKSLNLLFVEQRRDYFFLLFKNTDYAMGDFQIVAVQAATGDYGTYTVKNLIPFAVNQFMVTPEAALISGYYNYRPLVLHFHFGRQQSKILPGFFNEAGELNQIKLSADGTVDIIVSAKNFERKKCLWIRTYDGEGSLLKTIVLQPEADKHLIFGRSIKMPGGEQVVSGVYGRYTEYSRGIFLARINPYGEYTINYYNFADLQRFFNYMKAGREKRIKSRIERKKIKGKRIRFNYRILVHELIPHGRQLVMLGEAFYPHYSYAGRPGSSYFSSYSPFIPRFYANPLVRGELVFDGYQYTHAVVIGFDQNGKLLWDNSFEINDVRTMQLEQFVKVEAADDRLVLLYLYENTIRSKVIRDGDVIEGKAVNELRTGYAEDVVKPQDTQGSTLDYWYGNVFYAKGMQRVRNMTAAGVELNRWVFFINKITYE
jgi:hypothetical protein